MMNPLRLLKNGILTENPTFVLVLGLCHTGRDLQRLERFRHGAGGDRGPDGFERDNIHDKEVHPRRDTHSGLYRSHCRIRNDNPASDFSVCACSRQVARDIHTSDSGQLHTCELRPSHSKTGNRVSLRRYRYGARIHIRPYIYRRHKRTSGKRHSIQLQPDPSFYQPALLVILAPGGFITLGILIALFRNLQLRKEEASTGFKADFDGWENLTPATAAPLRNIAGAAD